MGYGRDGIRKLKRMTIMIVKLYFTK